MTDCQGLVVIDEVQRLPSLFETLRPLCDVATRRATFLLLDSAAPELVRGASETLAGRVQFVAAPGLSLPEVGATAEDRLWMRGAFPRPFLAGTFMVRVLPPWHENLGKRQVKAPKVYLRDSGLLHFILGIANLAGLRAHPHYGASWEGFALEQTLIAHGEKGADFWATQRGAELDLVVFRHGRRWGFEFECADAPGSTKAMHIALADLGLEHLYVVYPGSERFPLGDRITALSLWEAAGLNLGSSL